MTSIQDLNILTERLTINSSNDDIKSINIDFSTFIELQDYYNNVLNKDRSTYRTSNDEPTPIECVKDMVNKIPADLWDKENIKILDPCCGNGNFHLVILYKLLNKYDKKDILENILYFNDINDERLNNVRKIYNNDKYRLNISNDDYLIKNDNIKYDLIVANPPYAKLLINGKRASKNHNLIKDFLEKSLKLLKSDGFLLFITPDNWMSYADRNTIIKTITRLQIIHLDIHSAKKYFSKVGSSFTWYIIQNTPYYKDFSISGIWKKELYSDYIISYERSYIPLYYNSIIERILKKTINNSNLEKFNIITSSDLHHYTKKKFISSTETDTYKYKLIHTPKQIVYSSKPHKYQEGYKVFISTTDKYKIFIDNCGMTQSIAFIRCNDLEEAELYKKILNHNLYVFINNICRWGNFNNIRILQSFPKPNLNNFDDDNIIYNYFNITDDEKKFIKEKL
jgi:adenine-specific DNA-methyltransferase